MPEGLVEAMAMLTLTEPWVMERIMISLMLTPAAWAIFLWKVKKLSSNSARVTGKVVET